MTQVNFAQLFQEHAGGGQPLSDGIYDTVCTKAEGVTASTGKPMIKATFLVLTGPEANKTITNNFVLVRDNPNAFWIFVRHMAVFGVTEAQLAQMTDLQQLAPMMVNKQARLTVQKQPGRDLPNVSRCEPIPGGALSAAPGPSPADFPQPQLVAPQLPGLDLPQIPERYNPTLQEQVQHGQPAMMQPGEMVLPQHYQTPPPAPVPSFEAPPLPTQPAPVAAPVPQAPTPLPAEQYLQQSQAQPAPAPLPPQPQPAQQPVPAQQNGEAQPPGQVPF